jgi:hypothetical protein
MTESKILGESNILGDANRKSRFDPNLADEVNKQIEIDDKEAEIASRHGSKDVKPKIVESPAFRNFNMDTKSAASGASMRYNDWVSYWNSISVSDGRVMASCSDIYLAAKYNYTDFIHCFKSNLHKYTLTYDKILSYDKDSRELATKAGGNPERMIVSYDKNNVESPVERKVIIPKYHGMSLNAVLDNIYGLRFMQKLFNTDDSADVIKAVLEKLSGRNHNRTYVYTPDPSDINDPDRVIYFYYNSSFNFFINDSLSLNDRAGICYGVKHISEDKK